MVYVSDQGDVIISLLSFLLTHKNQQTTTTQKILKNRFQTHQPRPMAVGRFVCRGVLLTFCHFEQTFFLVFALAAVGTGFFARR
jgi:hypothetical protein